jgi:hypothetical protein
MYYLYKDKSNTFDCQVEVSGIEASKTTPRIIIENVRGNNFVFEGTLDTSGNCNVPLDSIKEFISEGDIGSIKLEIICENHIFTPWESQFGVKIDKKVSVTEVRAVEAHKPQVSVKIKQAPKSLDEDNSILIDHVNKLNSLFEGAKHKKGITKDNIFDFYQGKKLKSYNDNLIKEIKNSFINK